MRASIRSFNHEHLTGSKEKGAALDITRFCNEHSLHKETVLNALWQCAPPPSGGRFAFSRAPTPAQVTYKKMLYRLKGMKRSLQGRGIEFSEAWLGKTNNYLHDLIRNMPSEVRAVDAEGWRIVRWTQKYPFGPLNYHWVPLAGIHKRQYDKAKEPEVSEDLLPDPSIYYSQATRLEFNRYWKINHKNIQEAYQVNPLRAFALRSIYRKGVQYEIPEPILDMIGGVSSTRSSQEPPLAPGCIQITNRHHEPSQAHECNTKQIGV